MCCTNDPNTSIEYYEQFGDRVTTSGYLCCKSDAPVYAVSGVMDFVRSDNIHIVDKGWSCFKGEPALTYDDGDLKMYEYCPKGYGDWYDENWWQGSDQEEKVGCYPKSTCVRDCQPTDAVAKLHCTEATTTDNKPIKVCCQGGAPIATALSWSCTEPCQKSTCSVTDWDPNTGF